MTDTNTTFSAARQKGMWQPDTRQDAWYYGNWINPLTHELFSYCEGDTTHTQCDNDTEFVAQVRECCAWLKEHGHFLGIDTMCAPAIEEAFHRLGLADLLHGAEG